MQPRELTRKKRSGNQLPSCLQSRGSFKIEISMYIHCMYVTHWLSRRAKRMGLTDFVEPINAYITASLYGHNDDYIVLTLYWGCGWAAGVPDDVQTRWIKPMFGDWVDKFISYLTDLNRDGQIGVSDGYNRTSIVFPKSTFGLILKSFDGNNVRLV